MVLPTGIKRLALAAAGAPLVATMTIVMLASPSSAAPQPVKAAVVSHASSDHVFRTLHTGLRVRKRPSTSAKIVAVLGAVGSKVTVNCFTRGSTVSGDNVWYHIVQPRDGFVAGFYLATGGDPAVGVRACTVLHRTFRTLHTGLRVRERPSTSAKIVAVLGAVGSKVTVSCFTRGSTVFGDNVWYHIVQPRDGFVAGFYLATGGDPAVGIRHC
jgi:Bacterial SH3 domain